MTIKTIIAVSLPAAAIAATVLGAQESPEHHQSALPVSCAFDIEEGAFGQTLRGNVTANEDVSGRFEISFQKSGSNSANIQQSGRFRLDAGETQTLGQASLGGRGHVDAEMILTVGGQAYVCRPPSSIEL